MYRCLAVIGCLFIVCSQRDLSTPSKRLIGHWVRYDYVVENPNEPEIREIHFYFEPPNDNIGFYTITTSTQSKPNRKEYKILKEITPIDKISITIDDGLIWECHALPSGKMLVVTSRDFALSQELNIDMSFVDTLLYIDRKIRP